MFSSDGARGGKFTEEMVWEEVFIVVRPAVFTLLPSIPAVAIPLTHQHTYTTTINTRIHTTINTTLLTIF
jgi:hypothetical protein